MDQSLHGQGMGRVDNIVPQSALRRQGAFFSSEGDSGGVSGDVEPVCLRNKNQQ